VAVAVPVDAPLALAVVVVAASLAALVDAQVLQLAAPASPLAAVPRPLQVVEGACAGTHSVGLVSAMAARTLGLHGVPSHWLAPKGPQYAPQQKEAAQGQLELRQEALLGPLQTCSSMCP